MAESDTEAPEPIDAMYLHALLGMPQSKVASSHEATGHLGCGNCVLRDVNLYWNTFFKARAWAEEDA